jgi:hypothetical protein
MRETGDLVKKISGGSLEFAGIKDFSPGDPVSKIWWKGLAKSGKLMKKDFFSLAEDRWLLVIDLSDPNMKKEDEAALFTFSRAFVEMFTRKDIEVGIHIISPGASFLTYSTKKKDLLSFIVKHWSEFRHISHEGSREIIKDIVGDSSQIEDRCKVNGISLSSFLFYSGLFTKQKKTFYWSKDRVFRDNMTELLKNLRKSGKILVVTPKMSEGFVDQVRKLSSIKKCSLLFASFEKVPKAQTFIISRNNPEKTVWRLVYA